MKKVTREQAEKLLLEVGHQAHITVPVKLKENEQYANIETGENTTEEWKTVLNNAMVYNPHSKKQYGMSSNEKNAKNAMKFIKDRFYVYSSYFNWANGNYLITD